MNNTDIRKEIIESGLKLEELKLVSRTWGNISSRTENLMYITPSGIDYSLLKEEDIVECDLKTLTFDGIHKPSSEKGIHIASYEEFSDAKFVIHTHQDFATVLGFLENFSVTEEEKEMLGGISSSKYGLPSTKKLVENVRKEMKKGNHTILLKHHGTLIIASSKEEAFERVLLLENIAKRECSTSIQCSKCEVDIEKITNVYPELIFDSRNEIINLSKKKNVKVVIDDLAQLNGYSLKPIDFNPEIIIRKLKKNNIVLVKNVGAFIYSNEAIDRISLDELLFKESLVYLKINKPKHLSIFDSLLMRFVYKKKYSKKINGDK